ncbi:hypothetical protein Tco_0946114 [Tanacetum coccineum]
MNCESHEPEDGLSEREITGIPLDEISAGVVGVVPTILILRSFQNFMSQADPETLHQKSFKTCSIWHHPSKSKLNVNKEQVKRQQIDGNNIREDENGCGIMRGGIARASNGVTGSNASSIGVTSGIARAASNVTGVVVVWVIMGLMSASKYSYRDHNCWNSTNSL